MGSCVVIKKQKTITINKNETILSGLTPKAIVDEDNPKYQNFPDWEGERYTGTGVKRIRAYKCTLPINELNELRVEFWKEKFAKPNSSQWKTIKSAITMDSSMYMKIIL
jgi:hypothetical protein